MTKSPLLIKEYTRKQGEKLNQNNWGIMTGKLKVVTYILADATVLLLAW